MKDTDLRGIMLKQFYDRRRDGYIGWDVGNIGALEVPGGAEPSDMLRICDQLGEHGLLDWKPMKNRNGETAAGAGKIGASGIDVIEGEAEPPIAIHIVDRSQTVNVHSSTGVQIAGDNASQQQNVTQHVEGLLKAIDSAPGSAAEKKEAKSLLAAFLSHPVVGALCGTAAQRLLEILNK